MKIKNSVGKNISAIVQYPQEESDKLAVLCPGYLDSKDYKHLAGLAEVLNGRGYTVVRFDPTGTWESEGDISEYTTTQYLADIKSVIDHMLRQKEYKNVLLGGHSRGGQVAILYSARDARVSLVLGIMPSSGPVTGRRREEWEKTRRGVSWRDLPNNENEKREFLVPFNHVLDRDQYDVVEDVKKVRVPIILIAGELDDAVSPDDVREIFDAANEPKRFLLIKGIGHDYRHSPPEIEMVNNEILKAIASV